MNLSNDFLEKSAIFKEFDSCLKCGICFEYIKSAMMLPKCSHNYCSLCIRSYCRFKLQCPICLNAFAETDLLNNRCLDKIISLFSLLKTELIAKINTNNIMNNATICVNFNDTLEDSRIHRENLDDGIFNKSTVSEENFCIKNKSTIISSRIQSATKVIKQATDNNSDLKAQECSSNILTEINKPPPDCLTNIKVSCPVCSISVLSSNINLHLDKCLKRKNGPSTDCVVVSSHIKRKPLPKLVYALLSEKDLRKKLNDIGLPTNGDKQKLIKRHQDYVLLYNSQCDSLNPKPVSEIIKELLKNENVKSTNVASSPAKIFKIDKTTSNEEIEEINKNYMVQHKSQFTDLISAARKSWNKQKNNIEKGSSDGESNSDNFLVCNKDNMNEKKDLTNDLSKNSFDSKILNSDGHIQNAQNIEDSSKFHILDTNLDFINLDFNKLLSNKDNKLYLNAFSNLNSFEILESSQVKCVKCIVNCDNKNLFPNEKKFVNLKDNSATKTRLSLSKKETCPDELYARNIALDATFNSIERNKFSQSNSSALSKSPLPNLTEFFNDIENIVNTSGEINNEQNNFISHNRAEDILIDNSFKMAETNGDDKINNDITLGIRDKFSKDRKNEVAYKLSSNDGLIDSQSNNVSLTPNFFNNRTITGTMNNLNDKLINNIEINNDEFTTNNYNIVNKDIGLEDHISEYLFSSSDDFMKQLNDVGQKLIKDEGHDYRGHKLVDDTRQLKKAKLIKDEGLNMINDVVPDLINNNISVNCMIQNESSPIKVSMLNTCKDILRNSILKKKSRKLRKQKNSSTSLQRHSSINNCGDSGVVKLDSPNFDLLNDDFLFNEINKNASVNMVSDDDLGSVNADENDRVLLGLSCLSDETLCDISGDLIQSQNNKNKLSPVFEKKLNNIPCVSLAQITQFPRPEMQFSDEDIFTDLYKSPINSKKLQISDNHSSRSNCNLVSECAAFQKEKEIRCSLRSNKRKIITDFGEEDKKLKSTNFNKKLRTKN